MGDASDWLAEGKSNLGLQTPRSLHNPIVVSCPKARHPQIDICEPTLSGMELTERIGWP